MSDQCAEELNVRTLRRIADDMERAAELAERDPHRPVTLSDARRWAEEIDVVISPVEERAALKRVWPNFPI